jgi:hypothetical protein
VQFAGTSIGESLRQLAMRSRSVPLARTGSFIIVFANLFRFYTWWRALRQGQAETKAPINLQAVRQRDSSL